MSRRSRRTTFRPHSSPVIWTVRTTLNPAFSKARKDLRLVSSTSLTTAHTSRLEKTTLPYKLADCSRTQAQTCHAKLPYREVDTSRSRFRAQLARMLWIVKPEVPLNPTYRPNFLLDHEHVRRLVPSTRGPYFASTPEQIKSLIPPSRNVGGGKPFLKERKVGSFKRSAVYLPDSSDFRIRSTESIVVQLRVVAGAPNSLSIWPR